MISFILNEQLINTALPAGSTVLDFVRYHKRLTGTKVGCREGDCGACTILVGDVENGKCIYKSMTSCLMPLGNAMGKHIVTVEGINGKQLTPVQQAMVDTNGTQCGFCTIGFVMSLTGFVLDEQADGYDDAIKSIDGNICRCTGYKSIERAAQQLTNCIADKPKAESIEWLVKNNFVPGYFKNIPQRLNEIKNISVEKIINDKTLMIGGGTDLIVQKHHLVKHSDTQHLLDAPALKGISVENGNCIMGASTTVTEFAASVIIQNAFPHLKKHIKLISSTPIRNMATLAGNLVNASPIGDMTVFLLALDATVLLNDNTSKRTVALKDLYKGYKQLDKTADEFIEKIIFKMPTADAIFGFEKVCKRTYLDIASVNCACQIQLTNGVITTAHIAAGGVAAYPKYLSKTVAFLIGKKINADTLQQAIKIMNDEIAPISDARGTAAYKKLLLRQLFLAHFENDIKMIQTVVNI